MGTSHGAFIHPRTFSSLELAGSSYGSQSAGPKKRERVPRGHPPSSAAATTSFFFSTIAAASSAVLAERASIPPPSLRALAAQQTRQRHGAQSVRCGRGIPGTCAPRPQCDDYNDWGVGGGAHPRGACCHFVSKVARARQYRHAPMESPRTSPMRALANDATRGGGDAKTPYVRHRTRSAN
jgi:hypothetical protein